MIDIFKIFNGKNDLAKFLTVIGLLCFIFSLLYPIEKRKELDNQIIQYNLKVDQFNKRIKKLKETGKDLKDERQTLLKRLNKISLEQDIDQVNTRLSDIKKLSRKYYFEIEEAKIIISNNKDKITNLRVYLNEYEFYTVFLKFGGLIAFFIGLSSWAFAGVSEHNKQKQDSKD